MCLGIPMQVLEPGTHQARCAGPDGEVWVDLALVGPQVAGTWLLTFLGAAREVLDPARAEDIRQALGAVASLQQLGAAARPEDFDQFFADLVGREPQLPDFLRAPSSPADSAVIRTSEDPTP